MKNQNLRQALANHRQAFEKIDITELFETNPNRFREMSCSAAGLLLDYSKNRATAETMKLLVELAKQSGLEEAVSAMFSGSHINSTEDRAVLHTLLRASGSELPEFEAVTRALEKMEGFVAAVHNGDKRGCTDKTFTDVVNIGIGGSDLGPFMVTEALRPFHTGHLRTHFVSNVDGSDISECLQGLDPETTLIVTSSKTFTTLETLENARTARAWLDNHFNGEKDLDCHFVAVTSSPENAVNFGIEESSIFEMWDWVGGRYSLWSAIGLSIALAIGMDGFRQLLAGAEQMDIHFRSTPLAENMPVILGLLGIWYINYWGAQSHVVLPYDHYLRYLPKYLQQLDMESNGKSVTQNGSPVATGTGPVIWGDAGTNGQHSFHQLLHQGTNLVPADFILVLKSHNPVGDHHDHLVSNCLSQSRALMTGKTLDEARGELRDQGMDEAGVEALAPHKVMPGNRPSNTVVVEQVTPQTLGALIALYEHKVYVQSVIWDINAFDQWGVELGKQLSRSIYGSIIDGAAEARFDPSTEGLITLFREARQSGN